MKTILQQHNNPIFRFSNNFFTGPNNHSSLLRLQRLKVNVIVSVFPKAATQCEDLREFEKENKVKVIYPERRSFLRRFWNHPEGDMGFANGLAAIAFKFSKRQRVAVVCLHGDFSKELVAPEYLKLEKAGVFSSGRMAIGRMAISRRIKRKPKTRRRR